MRSGRSSVMAALTATIRSSVATYASVPSKRSWNPGRRMRIKTDYKRGRSLAGGRPPAQAALELRQLGVYFRSDIHLRLRRFLVAFTLPALDQEPGLAGSGFEGKC